MTLLDEGSCWTFSAAAAVEGINQIVTGEMISLSEQELLDCSTGSYGCEGGFTEKAFEYIIRNCGIDTEEDYPYVGFQTQCNADRAKVVSIDGYESVPKYDERSLQKLWQINQLVLPLNLLAATSNITSL